MMLHPAGVMVALKNHYETREKELVHAMHALRQLAATRILLELAGVEARNSRGVQPKAFRKHLLKWAE